MKYRRRWMQGSIGPPRATCSPRIRPGIPDSLRCISHSSRMPDPRYLHSRMYFALERAFRSTDPHRRRPSISDYRVFSPSASAMMKSSVLRRHKSGMKLSNFFADFCAPRMARVSLWRRRRRRRRYGRRLQYVFLLPLCNLIYVSGEFRSPSRRATYVA